MSKNDEAWRQYRQDILDRMGGDTISVFSGVQKQSKPNAEGWVSGCCPFHGDKEPSFGFNINNGKWHCFAGCGGGSIFDFISHSRGISFNEALVELGDSCGLKRPAGGDNGKIKTKPAIGESKVQGWKKALAGDDGVRQWVREKRGLSDATMDQFDIGWDAGRQRNTIPVRDERGNVQNVRLYNAKKKPKIVNYTEGKHKYGSPARLYGLDVLDKTKPEDAKQVIICEGEWDRLLLQQEGFLAVTGTHGAGTFRPEWVEHFEGRDVALVFDCDPEGQGAAVKTVLEAFRGSKVASIKNVLLPLKGSKDDKDITDYLHGRGFTAADLQKLIDDTPAHSYVVEEVEEEIVGLESFADIQQKRYINKRVRCDLTVCGETSDAFHAIEEYQVVTCPRLRAGKCFECQAAVTAPVRVHKSAQLYIGSCMSTNVQLKAALREHVCRHGQQPTVEIKKRATVKEFFAHQRINRLCDVRDDQSLDEKKQELIELRVYYISSDAPKPGDYRVVGWVKSHPKTQRVTLLIESMEALEDDYESFRVEDHVGSLLKFKSIPFGKMIKDISNNITRIYKRDDILLATLLTFCSPRWIPFNDDTIRGWLVMLIIGDSGAGKTQTYQRLASWTGVGDLFSGLTGSRTGLAYALVDHKQKGWEVRIGRYPANSRKILCVDEAQHLEDKELRTISIAMESGLLQIDRVTSKSYEAQTRLIMIANPKSDAVMDGFSFGCKSLATFLPPTMIRRTDLAVFANAGDLAGANVINRSYERNTPLVSPEALRAVFFWAWNLRPDQIKWEEGAESEALEAADAMFREFGFATDVPLVQESDMRNKIARIATAWAILTLQTDDGFKTVTVGKPEVRMTVAFLRRIYTHENAQLDSYSKISERSSQLGDYVDIEKRFLQKIEADRHSGDKGFFMKIIYIMHAEDCIRRDDLAEQVGCSLDTIKRVVKMLKGCSMIDTRRNGYVKKPKFNKFYRRFEKDHPEVLDSWTPILEDES